MTPPDACPSCAEVDAPLSPYAPLPGVTRRFVRNRTLRDLSHHAYEDASAAGLPEGTGLQGGLVIALGDAGVTEHQAVAGGLDLQDRLAFMQPRLI